MAKSNTKHIRIQNETKKKIEELKLDLQRIQRQAIPEHEILRRTFSIPNLRNVLIEDARAKNRMKSLRRKK